MTAKRQGLADVFATRAAVTKTGPEVDKALEDIWKKASSLWPGVNVPPVELMNYLADRIPEGADLLAALDGLHTGDLYLACACARNQAQALAAFEQAYVTRVPAYLKRGNAPADFIHEVAQKLRKHLFLADGAEPRITAYSGLGPLGAWVRMTALRIALDLERAQGSPPGAYRFEAQTLQPAREDPELGYLRKRYGAVVVRAIEATLSALPAREATLLRLFFMQGVSYEAIGVIHHVSRSKARRWVVEIRSKIVEQTRRHLVDELGVTGSQVDSLIRLVSSDLDTSIVRCLK